MHQSQQYRKLRNFVRMMSFWHLRILAPISVYTKTYHQRRHHVFQSPIGRSAVNVGEYVTMTTFANPEISVNRAKILHVLRTGPLP